MKHGSLTVAALLLSLLVLAPSASEARGKRKSRSDETSTKAVRDLVAQAKAQMSLGSRKQALASLDRAAAATRSKQEQRELAAKRALYCDQFITADSFQSYQEARSFAVAEQWDECARTLDAVGEKDRDNLLVLRQRAECLLSGRQFGGAEAAFRAVLGLVPRDVAAGLGLVEIAVATKQAVQGLATLDSISPGTSGDLERAVILRSQLLQQSEREDEAVRVLRDDQEKHLDHVGVLYELGMLYMRLAGHDWQARKILSTFVSRCKRMREGELKARHLDTQLPQAQAALGALDKKLGV